MWNVGPLRVHLHHLLQGSENIVEEREEDCEIQGLKMGSIKTAPSGHEKAIVT